jgi:diaminohydroxyphosphoribosylaminopyrimidine deaminase/5-amino-6-(5-phosphoribosylamino)uracil reductase
LQCAWAAGATAVPACWHFPQVVIGCGDPNPLVAAAGIATLQSAGIQVALVGGAEEQQCYDVNQEFMERMKQQAAGSS